MPHQKTQWIFGFHPIIARLRQNATTIEIIYVDGRRIDRRMQALLHLAHQASVQVVPVETQRLSGMVSQCRHQGVVAKVAVLSLAHTLDELLDVIDVPPLLLILDSITDPHNLGACLRAAEGAGAHAVIAPKDRAVGLTATAMKVASGAAESLPYLTVTNLARTLCLLKERDIRVIGTVAETQMSLYDAPLCGALALVMGAEGEGMRRLTREHCDDLVHIPMLGAVHSLNVSVAAGVSLYEAQRQRRRVS